MPNTKYDFPVGKRDRVVEVEKKKLKVILMENTLMEMGDKGYLVGSAYVEYQKLKRQKA